MSGAIAMWQVACFHSPVALISILSIAGATYGA